MKEDLINLSEDNQEDLNQEFKDLISTLQTEESWITKSPIHLHKGFWLTSTQLKSLLALQKHFKAKSSDIFIVTNPKAGTTWLKAISFALLNRSRFLTNPSENHPLLVKNPHGLVPFLEFEEFNAENFKLPHFNSYESPRLFATHLPFNSLPFSVRGSGCKIVYLYRNPKDVLVSLWKFANNLSHREGLSIEEAFEGFCKGVILCGPFWEHALEYWKASLEMPEKVLFIKFEELKENPNLHVKKLAEFMGCPISAEEEEEGVLEQILKLCSFEFMSKLEVNRNGKAPSGTNASFFFRKGEVGDWKNYLTEEMTERIDAITEEKFHGSGLEP